MRLLLLMVQADLYRIICYMSALYISWVVLIRLHKRLLVFVLLDDQLTIWIMSAYFDFISFLCMNAVARLRLRVAIFPLRVVFVRLVLSSHSRLAFDVYLLTRHATAHAPQYAVLTSCNR